MNKERLQYLVEQFIANQLSIEEQQEFYMLLQQPEHEASVLMAFEAAGGEIYASDTTDDTLLPLLQRAPMADKPERHNVQPIVHRVHFMRRWGWAAAVLVLLSAGTWFWWTNNTAKSNKPALAQTKPDVAPGRDGAILTLADGQKIVLDSLGNGTIANQNGTNVVLNNGQLMYAANGVINNSSEQLNTMQTPKGRQFNVTLPDGTRVWLNAASSITFPTAFSGNERRVKVAGEVYLEVAKNKEKPFFVNVNDKADIEVLGTSFNVNSYTDEPQINTTLLEGSVVVNSNESKNGTVLKPGQQAQIGKTGINIKQAEIDKVMAWRYGAFNFEGASLQEVMRQLTRWYDIEVVYETGIPDIHFVGEMSRDMNLAGVLKALEATNVHFRLENNKRLIVEP